MEKPSKEVSKSHSGLFGFFANLFLGFLGGPDSDRAKKKPLREIRNALRRRSRFYSLRSNRALPALAQWFYELFRVLGPAAASLAKYCDSDLLKVLLVEHFLSEDSRKTVAELQPERLKERVATSDDMKALSEQIKKQLLQVYAALDNPTALRVDKLYTDMRRLQSLASYPYQHLLRRFDFRFSDMDFVYKPRFVAIDAQKIKNDLADFLDVFYALDGEAEWDVLFDILKEYREADIISRTAWKEVVSGRQEMQKTKTLELIVRHLDQNPSWSAMPEKKHYRIVEWYFKNIKSITDRTLEDSLKNRKKLQRDHLLMKLFGTTSVKHTQHYTEQRKIALQKNKLVGYTYVEPINYLSAFYQDYYKKQIRTLINLLLVRGKWVTRIASSPYSEADHQLLSLSDQLTTFDIRLGIAGEIGIRIKRLQDRLGRDKTALMKLGGLLVTVNAEAKDIITKSVQHMIFLGKNVKLLDKEYKNQGSEIIINWKEIEGWSEKPLGQQLSDIYARIYYLVQLLQLEMKKRASESGK